MLLGLVFVLVVSVSAARERDVEYDSLEGAGEVGASPELEGVAQAEVEDLGVWVGPGGLPGCGSPGR